MGAFRIEWWRNVHGYFNWHAVAANNEVLWASTQGYENKADMVALFDEFFAGVPFAEGGPR